MAKSRESGQNSIARANVDTKPRNHAQTAENLIEFSPQLARAVGVKKAIILHQLQKQLVNEGVIYYGAKWVRLSYQEWSKLLPFFAVHQLKRLLLQLECDGYIMSSSQFNILPFDRTKWYSMVNAPFDFGNLEIGGIPINTCSPGKPYHLVVEL